MPGLHSLCLSPSSMLPSNSNNNSSSIKVTTKPATTLSFSIKEQHHQQQQSIDDHLPLPLPDLPSHVKEKILFLELLGIDSGRALSLNPDLRSASSDSINSIVSYLLSKGIHHKDLARIFGMCPKILTSSISADIAPVFRFLYSDLLVP
ncbi:PH-like domain-containing protein [Dioscorea alata]|uniref:PH-like domain-containing protein n=1 Tax=Dioscorea alata TaxID=55571 RepID=A0ACB7VIJ6_DIOAL|nr:PH-like domain-containing protein [Dioscorea alata]